MIKAMLAVVVGLVAVEWAHRSGYVKGHRTGHDRVIRWMLENSVLPETWDPSKEWCDA